VRKPRRKRTAEEEREVARVAAITALAMERLEAILREDIQALVSAQVPIRMAQLEGSRIHRRRRLASARVGSDPEPGDGE
jgi:hypothetical protein